MKGLKFTFFSLILFLKLEMEKNNTKNVCNHFIFCILNYYYFLLYIKTLLKYILCSYSYFEKLIIYNNFEKKKQQKNFYVINREE